MAIFSASSVGFSSGSVVIFRTFCDSHMIQFSINVPNKLVISVSRAFKVLTNTMCLQLFNMAYVILRKIMSEINFDMFVKVAKKRKKNARSLKKIFT